MAKSIYSKKMLSLSAGERSAFKKEYEANQASGKSSYKSKITGLEYAIDKQASKIDTKELSSKTPSFPKSIIDEPKRSEYKRPGDGLVPGKSEKPTEYSPQLKSIFNNTSASDDDNIATEYSKPVKKVQAPLSNYKPASLEARAKAKAMDAVKYDDFSVPKSITGLVKKLTTGTNRKNNDSYDQFSRGVIFKAVEKAKAAGKSSIDYEDYKGIGSKQDDKDLEDLQSGKMNAFTAPSKLRKSKVLDVAASLGGASTKPGTKPGTTNVTDYYDFVNARSLVDGKVPDSYMSLGETLKEKVKNIAKAPGYSAYKVVRRALAKNDEGKSIAELERDFKTDLTVTPADTIGFAKKRAELLKRQ